MTENPPIRDALGDLAEALYIAQQVEQDRFLWTRFEKLHSTAQSFYRDQARKALDNTPIPQFTPPAPAKPDPLAWLTKKRDSSQEGGYIGHDSAPFWHQLLDEMIDMKTRLIILEREREQRQR